MRILNTPISSVLIHISSADCAIGDDTFQLNLESPLLCPPGYTMLLSLASAEIPFSFYICNKYNNTLLITENGINRTILITEGNYSTSSLKAKVLSLLGPNYTMSYNSDSMKYTFTTTLNNVIFDFVESTSNELLGFSKIQSQFVNGILISNKVINFNYTNSLFLVSDFTDIGSMDSKTKKYSNILAKIPINTMAGGMIYYYGSQTTHKIIYHSAIIHTLKFKITDDRQRPIDMNGIDYDFSLLIDFSEKETLLPGLDELGVSKQLL